MLAPRARTIASFLAVLSITACAAIFGISDPEIERAVPEGDGGDGGPAGPGDAMLLADGALACATGLGDCNASVADGCEEILATSSAHCGACGHSCLGGSCNDGRCQPVAISQGDAGDCSGFVAVQGGDVFFNAGVQDAVFSVPKTGGPTKKWLSFAASPSGGRQAANGLYVDGSFIGGSNYYARNLLLDRADGKWMAVGPCPNTVLGITIDDTGRIYAVQTEPCGGGNATIRQYAREDGGLAQQWSVVTKNIGTAEPAWLAFDASYVYYVAERTTANEGVYRVSRDGGTGETFVADGGAYAFSSSPLVIDGDRLYARRAGAIIAIERSTGTVTELATGQSFITLINNAYVRMSIAYDATHVYWTARDPADKTKTMIMRIKKTPGAPVETVVAGQPFGFGMAVDDDAIYWTTTSGVFRLAK